MRQLELIRQASLKSDYEYARNGVDSSVYILDNTELTDLTTVSLDELAETLTNKDKTYAKLPTRARAKYRTVYLNQQMREYGKPDERMNKHLESALACNQILIETEDAYIASNHCRKRHCIVCNHISSQRNQEKYLPAIQSFEQPYFVTLTRPNVPVGELYQEIKDLYATFRALQVYRTNHKLERAKGLRKLECTYNPSRQDFHPHFHLIVENERQAEELVRDWLRVNERATRAAQDYRACDQTAMIELFKYFAKICNTIAYRDEQTGEYRKKIAFYPEPMTRIFESISGTRTFQPFGIKAAKIDKEKGVKREWLASWHWEQGEKNWTRETLQKRKLTKQKLIHDK